MADNRAALDRGFDKARGIIRNKMLRALMGVELSLAVEAQNRYIPEKSFTGNTWTGTAVGAYADGKLVYYKTTKDLGMQPPVHRKLRLDEVVHLKSDYLGRDRVIRGSIDTDGGTSEEDAVKFLNRYSPKSKYSVVVANGSEYAEYVESVLDGDVITGTYNYAKRMRLNDFITVFENGF